jgi:hypothetical protein
MGFLLQMFWIQVFWLDQPRPIVVLLDSAGNRKATRRVPDFDHYLGRRKIKAGAPRARSNIDFAGCVTAAFGHRLPAEQEPAILSATVAAPRRSVD